MPNECGIKWHSFEFNHHIAAEFQVIENQVDVEVLVANFEQDLATNEGEACPEFQQETT